MSDIEIIRKFALKNAIDYGKADFNAVLGKVIANIPNAKEHIEEYRKLVKEVIDKINAMKREEIVNEYKNYEEEFKEKEKIKKEETSHSNISIEGAEIGKVITRFPPEPGGYIHIGNAKQAILSDEIAKMYKGSIYLYFDDTNPEKSKLEYVYAIKEDTNWLGINFAKEYYASDFIPRLYEFGKELIEKGLAYVCLCSEEEIKNNRKNKVACEHRNYSINENLSLFNDMLNNKFDDGEAVLRLKLDIASPNPAMRDPTLFRVKHKIHYRQGDKYFVWPTYHMATPIVDSLNGITDVIRSKEYELYRDVHIFILKNLNLRIPRIHEEARLRIRGNVTQKRILRELMNKGILMGWDDPRLVTIKALRRRGIQALAIRRFVLRFGLSKTDSEVDMDMLLSENRKIIDPIAKRLFAVIDPIKINIESFEKSVSLPIHPDRDIGYREYKVENEVFISKSDYESIREKEIINLKGLAQIEIIKKDNSFINAKISDLKGEKTIQWVPAKNNVRGYLLIINDLLDKNGEINKNSIERKEVLIEDYINKLNENELIQFERIGFFKLDKKNPIELLSL